MTGRLEETRDFLNMMGNWSRCFCVQTMAWVVVSDIFYFHPYLGKIPNLTNSFQMG